jgi:hypothetical protein
MELKAIIAFAWRMALSVSSKLPSDISRSIAVGFPLLVIITSPSAERLFQMLFGVVLKSLTE